MQTANGKAFEYACLSAFYHTLQTGGEVVVEDSPQMRTARNLYHTMSGEVQRELWQAANAAVRVVLRLEPWCLLAPLSLTYHYCLRR